MICNGGIADNLVKTAAKMAVLVKTPERARLEVQLDRWVDGM